jgi:signal transduction histidine kinase
MYTYVLVYMHACIHMLQTHQLIHAYMHTHTHTHMQVISTLTPTLKLNVSLHSKIDPNLAPVKGDVQRVTQILFNLAGNAIKFTAKGSVTITADALLDSNMVSISVKDTGIGLAPDELDKVFLPFTQGTSLCYTILCLCFCCCCCCG